MPNCDSAGTKEFRSTNRLHAELRIAGGYGAACAPCAPTTAQASPRQYPIPAPPPPPAAKKCASWILTPPGKRADADRAALAQSTARCEENTTARALVREFADMLCHRHGERLEDWATQAETSPVSELRGFAKGLRKDWAAVTAGLTVPYSSGAVEGHVNRIKMTAQMRGRAKPDLLRPPGPARRLSPSRQLGQSHIHLAVDNRRPLDPEERSREPPAKGAQTSARTRSLPVAPGQRSCTRGTHLTARSLQRMGAHVRSHPRRETGSAGTEPAFDLRRDGRI